MLNLAMISPTELKIPAEPRVAWLRSGASAGAGVHLPPCVAPERRQRERASGAQTLSVLASVNKKGGNRWYWNV